jgi:hypothetical protein
MQEVGSRNLKGRRSLMSWLPRTAAAMLEGGRRGGGEEEENECEWAGVAAADQEMERREEKHGMELARLRFSDTLL